MVLVEDDSTDASMRMRTRRSTSRLALSPLPVMRGKRPCVCWRSMRAFAVRNIAFGSFRFSLVNIVQGWCRLIQLLTRKRSPNESSS